MVAEKTAKNFEGLLFCHTLYMTGVRKQEKGGARVQDASSRTLLYAGRTRLDSREYEQLMPYQYFCTLCSYRSKRQGQMNKHRQLHERGVTVLQCSQCSYSTTQNSHLTRHKLRQHSGTCLPCTVNGCTYVASSDRYASWTAVSWA